MLTWLAAFLILAQSAAKPEFEVASIKPTAPGEPGSYIRLAPGGRVDVRNMSLKGLIALCYSIQPFQISGGPAWLDSDHFDINAKPEKTPKQEDVILMIQSLLAGRFQLVFTRETKEMPIYALVMARKDGKPGPRLTVADCVPFDPLKAEEIRESGKTMCGSFGTGRGAMTAVGIPVSNLAPALARMLGRTVIDKTGLAGDFDFKLEWTPDETSAPRPADAPRAPDAVGPSLFTALQEQLGLKLESQKGPVEIFVIQKAEKPAEN